jgi:hypothetical protein
MRSILTGLGAALALAGAARADPPDTAKAKAAFAERQAICDRDAGRLWGRSLCGPMLLIDPQTRRLVANQAGPGLAAQDGVFVGRLPDGMGIANTAFDWAGTRWTMVTWPLPQDAVERRALEIHESYHRIQDALGLPARSYAPAHLAMLEGRVNLRLEFRALAAALMAADASEARRDIADALAFRRRRWASAGEGAEQERKLELNEGLAEYTGRRLAGAADPAAAAAAMLGKADGWDAYARRFAYASGPAYGLLLDRYSPDWRRKLTAGSDLAAVLGAAAGVTATADLEAAEARYGGAAIRAQETPRAQARAEAAAAWTAKLVDGPHLRLALTGRVQVEFDPRTVFPLPPHGAVYPANRISDEWGSLVVDGGVLVAGDWAWAQVKAPASADGRKGDGWTLTLAPGWELAPGERAGDWVVRKAP